MKSTGFRTLGRFPDGTDCDVILKIPPDAGQVLDTADPEASQLELVTDARQHQHFRGVQGT